MQPDYPIIINTWRKSAKEVETRNGEYTFDDFVEFVQDASRDANHPVFSYEALSVARRGLENNRGADSKQKGNMKIEKKRNRGTTFKVVGQRDDQEKKTGKSGNTDPNACPVCSDTHLLEHCKEFLSKSPKERVAFCKSKGVCFACLVRGHMIKHCKNKRQCDECKKTHATLLHYTTNSSEADYKKEASEAKEVDNPVSVCNASSCGTTTTSLIMPVWLSRESNPEREIEVYAVVDDQSNTCFVTEDVCSERRTEYQG